MLQRGRESDFTTSSSVFVSLSQLSVPRLWAISLLWFGARKCKKSPADTDVLFKIMPKNLLCSSDWTVPHLHPLVLSLTALLRPSFWHAAGTEMPWTEPKCVIYGVNCRVFFLCVCARTFSAALAGSC